MTPHDEKQLLEGYNRLLVLKTAAENLWSAVARSGDSTTWFEHIAKMKDALDHCDKEIE